jgi:hypothetical protein
MKLSSSTFLTALLSSTTVGALLLDENRLQFASGLGLQKRDGQDPPPNPVCSSLHVSLSRLTFVQPCKTVADCPRANDGRACYYDYINNVTSLNDVFINGLAQLGHTVCGPDGTCGCYVSCHDLFTPAQALTNWQGDDNPQYWTKFCHSVFSGAGGTEVAIVAGCNVNPTGGAGQASLQCMMDCNNDYTSTCEDPCYNGLKGPVGYMVGEPSCPGYPPTHYGRPCDGAIS